MTDLLKDLLTVATAVVGGSALFSAGWAMANSKKNLVTREDCRNQRTQQHSEFGILHEKINAVSNEVHEVHGFVKGLQERKN